MEGRAQVSWIGLLRLLHAGQGWSQHLAVGLHEDLQHADCTCFMQRAEHMHVSPVAELA